METQKSFADYWELVKTWLENHQYLVVWPFRKIGDLFDYVWHVIQDGTTQERVILAGWGLAFLLVAYLLFMLGLREILIRLPGFNRVPFGLPKSDDYEVKPTGYDRPVEFEWRYPLLWVGGTEFNFTKAMLDAHDPLRFYLTTGTEVLFVPKPHKLRGN